MNSGEERPTRPSSLPIHSPILDHAASGSQQYGLLLVPDNQLEIIRIDAEEEGNIINSDSENNNVENSGNPGSETDTAPEDALQADRDDDDEDETRGVTRRRRAGLGKNNATATMTLIESVMRRSEVAKRRSETLLHCAKVLDHCCGAQVYLKFQYVGPRKTITEFYGRDFALKAVEEEPEEVVEQNRAGQDGSIPIQSPEDLRGLVVESVAEGVAKGFANQALVGASQASQNDQIQDTLRTPTTSGRRSTCEPRRAITENCCQRCLKSSEYIQVRPGVRFKAAWFHCSFSGCRGRAHNDCLGLPQAKFEDVQALTPFYCFIHVGAGRLVTEETNDEDEEIPLDLNSDIPVSEGEGMPPPPATVASGTGRGRGPGRPRGSRGNTGRGGRGGAAAAAENRGNTRSSTDSRGTAPRSRGTGPRGKGTRGRGG